MFYITTFIEWRSVLAIKTAHKNINRGACV